MAVINKASSVTTLVQETIKTLSSTFNLPILILLIGKKRGRLKKVNTSSLSSSVPRREPKVSV
jgi:hypothetical protein